MAFAAGQGSRIPRQAQIIEAHIVEKVEAFANFLQDATGNLVLLLRKLFVDAGEPHICFLDRELRHLTDMTIADADGECFRLQAKTCAGFTVCDVLKFFDFLAGPGAVGLSPATVEVGDHPLKGFLGFVRPQAIVIGESDDVIA